MKRFLLQRGSGCTLVALLWVLGYWTFGVSSVVAHEPLFGVGPHTIWQNGLGLEAELEVEEGHLATHYEAMYGITPDLAVTLAGPWVRRKEGNRTSSGLGDLALRAKYRFFRKDGFGKSDGVALVLGVKFPTGDEHAAMPLGTGSTDFFGGVAAGRESRRWYGFGDLRYRVNREANGLKRGDIFFYDAAWGVRPWRTAYEQPDLVLLVELNGKVTGRNRRNGTKDPNTGGRVLSVSPGFLFSVRNVMFKGGANLPILWDLNGEQEDPVIETVLGLEFHIYLL